MSTQPIDSRARWLAALQRIGEAHAGRVGPLTTERAAFLLAVLALLCVWAFYAHALGFLCDDAFVSFRYVRNLLAGEGLVWNRGERVEGYTNFAWVLEIAALGALFRIPAPEASIALSVLCTLGTFWVTMQLARGTPFAKYRELAALLALALLVVNRNVAVWTTSGLETRQFTFAIVLAVLLMHRERSGVLRYIPASIAFGFAELTRPEASLFFACGAAYLLCGSLLERRFALRELAGYLVPYVLIVGAHTAFRLAYYGELVPNTYYAKDVGPWLEGGAAYLVTAIVENGLYLVWPIAGLGLVARLALRRDGVHVLSLMMLGAHLAYLFRIGGDHFELRPFDVHWPLLAVASADGLLLLAAGGRRLAKRLLPDHVETVGSCTLACAGIVLTAYCTVLQLAQHVTTYSLTTRAETRGLVSPIDPQRFAPAFLLPGLQHLLVPYNAALAYTAAHSIGLRWAEHRAFQRSQSASYAPYAPYVEGLFPEDAVMADGTIGVLGYALRGLTIIDILGLTDRVVAHNPVDKPTSQRQMAHDRSPPIGYLEQRGVNLEVLPAAARFDAASGFALKLRDGLWMPLASAQPEWLVRAFAGRGLWHRELSPELHKNRVSIAGERFEPTRMLGFFDGVDLDGWTASGAALKEPRAKVGAQSAIHGAMGAALANSFHPKHGDRARGSLLSPELAPAAGDHLAFLVGGGKQARVGVELRVQDRVVATFRGLDSEVLALEVVDLSAYAGKSCRVRIVDDSEGPWGHVLADHFMIMRRAEGVGVARGARAAR